VASHFPNVCLDRLVSIALQDFDFSFILDYLFLPNLQELAADLTNRNFTSIYRHCDFLDLQHLFIGLHHRSCGICIWGSTVENASDSVPGSDCRFDNLDDGDALGRRFHIRFTSYLGREENPEQVWTDIESFLIPITHKATHLSKLVLHSMQYGEEWPKFRTKVLYQFPQIRTLSIGARDQNFAFLDLFNDPGLCPNLVRLDYDNGDYVRTKRQLGKPIVDCIRSRLRLSANGRTTLEQINLKGYPLVASRWVKCLANWGIALRIVRTHGFCPRFRRVITYSVGNVDINNTDNNV